MYQLETRFARINVSARYGIFFRNKRAYCGKDGLKFHFSRLSCTRRVLQHSSRGIALHLSAASNRKVCQMRCIISHCKFRRPNRNLIEYDSYCLKNYYITSAGCTAYIYALWQWVRSVCQSQKNIRNTNITSNNTYNLIVVVLGSGL